MTDNIQQLDSDDGLNVVQIDGTVIEPMLPAFDKINSNFETVDAAIRNEFSTADDAVLADASADATTKADAAELAAKTYADGILATETSDRDAADTVLQSNIDAEIARATAIESGLRTDVDSVQSQVTANDSDILSLQNSVGTDVSDLQSQLDAEIFRATTNEGINADAIVAENTRATAIEAGLRTDIDQNAFDIFDADSDILALQNLVNNDVSDLQSQLSAEISRATAEEGVNAAAVVTEKNRAEGIEAGLRTDVDVVTGRVDTIIGSSPETLDTIQEIVSAFENADSDLQQVITNNSGRLTTAETDIVAVEVRTTDLETAVTQNQSKVGTGSFNTTAQNNVDAVNELHGELDASVSRIDGHDTVVSDLQTQITSEVNRATTQESTILSELAASSGVLDNQNSSGNPVKLWTGTQSQYSALTPDPDTLYFITG
jgi:predicted  nucleic acid-binding Zn-ribbon protein